MYLFNLPISLNFPLFQKRSYGGGGGQYGGYSERMGSMTAPSGAGGGANGMQGQNSVRRNFMTGLVGGEYEAQVKKYFKGKC